MTEVKSFSDTQPDFGVAGEPVEDQRYDDGRAHVLDGGGDDGGWDGGDDGGDDGAGDDGVVPPPQVTPFRAKLAGAGLLPFQEPLKPNDVEPLVGIEPL